MIPISTRLFLDDDKNNLRHKMHQQVKFEDGLLVTRCSFVPHRMSIAVAGMQIGG